MTGWLAPVVDALESVADPCPFFFRDDDAGWGDAALLALLDEFEAAGVAVDVAAIPLALSHAGARHVVARLDGRLVHVHQHGYAHVNHERAGRKCEFGVSRSAAAQTADVRVGRARLEDVLGRGIEPVFTPPWNRCSPATVGAVMAAGHRVLSRDDTAGRLDRPGLAEVPVTIDWSAQHRGVPVTANERGRAIARGVLAGGPVGVMLHHALIDADERAEVRRLLDLVARSPRTVPTTILSLAETERTLPTGWGTVP
jgi:hypothetical protein